MSFAASFVSSCFASASASAPNSTGVAASGLRSSFTSSSNFAISRSAAFCASPPSRASARICAALCLRRSAMRFECSSSVDFAASLSARVSSCFTVPATSAVAEAMRASRSAAARRPSHQRIASAASGTTSQRNSSGGRIGSSGRKFRARAKSPVSRIASSSMSPGLSISEKSSAVISRSRVSPSESTISATRRRVGRRNNATTTPATAPSTNGLASVRGSALKSGRDAFVHVASAVSATSIA